MAHGVLTAQIARTLSQEMGHQGFDVLYDHGHDPTSAGGQVGRLRSWFGGAYRSSNILANVDIAVVTRDSDKVCAVIEIEETTDKPKAILGDVLATLLGHNLTFQGNRHLHVGPWTALIVMVHSADDSHSSRAAYLEQEINRLRPCMSTPNAQIGRIVIDSFQSELDLERKLKQQITRAIEQFRG